MSNCLYLEKKNDCINEYAEYGMHVAVSIRFRSIAPEDLSGHEALHPTTKKQATNTKKKLYQITRPNCFPRHVKGRIATAFELP